ncbi:unnamed protein product [Phytophthora fragariaefolia]|uniref:Unnamed protein product n=1 Tax=Phytophthora fragariaefolia TaxID=1490495 RepID=A0A9W6XM27_9STRA|nr:unnamed protein product [Phytophthora fragariaefolia]
MYQWMEWVIDRNMPLSEVDDPHTRNMSRLKPICSKTLKVFMGKVVAAVEAKISSEMTGLFGIMFDGWTCFLEHYSTVEAVSALMAALRTVNNRAALREHTPLSPLRPNATRWSSTFEMMARYVRIRDEIKKVEAVFDLIPRAAMHRKIEALLADLRVFHSVTIKLQAEDLTLADVRALFDSVAQRFPSMKPKVSASASIVHSPTFEAAIVKVLPCSMNAIGVLLL